MFKCSGYGLGEMVKNISSPRVLEIGCDVGDTSEFLLCSNENLILYGVDPYADYIDWNGRDLINRNDVYINYIKRMNAFGDRLQFNRKYSDEAVNDYDNEFFDVIFIDGLHTYEQLIKDCNNYYSKLKNGGIFAGHDFTVIDGVNKAAKEFAQQVNKQILTTECDVWYWIK